MKNERDARPTIEDTDANAKALFEKNAAGYRNKTPWEELHEDTRQLWRDEAKKRGFVSTARCSRDFAALVRPAVKRWLTSAEQAVLKCERGGYPAHYKGVLDRDADDARKALDEIEAILGEPSLSSARGDTEK